MAVAPIRIIACGVEPGPSILTAAEALNIKAFNGISSLAPSLQRLKWY